MKKLIIIILLIGAGLTRSVAQSMLKVSTADGRRVNVSVDGRYFNKTGTSVTIGDLPGGRHYLQVYTMSQTRRGRGYEELLYEGKVKTFDGMVTLFVYGTDSGNDIQTQDLSSYLAAHPIPNANNGQNNGNYNNGNYNNNDGGNSQVASPVNPGTLTDTKIDNLKTTVAAKATDTEKMALLKQELANEKITTAQVGAIMDWLSFESAKVNFAEWAYNITVDKQYFSDLENKFTYKNSQDDLDKFIKSKQ